VLGASSRFEIVLSRVRTISPDGDGVRFDFAAAFRFAELRFAEAFFAVLRVVGFFEAFFLLVFFLLVFFLAAFFAGFREDFLPAFRDFLRAAIDCFSHR